MIIAEFSHNHLGSKERLLQMVEVAAKAGVTFCKIQTHFSHDLSPEWKHEYERVKGYELDFDTHGKFVDHCMKHGVIPMTSVYTDRYAQDLWAAGFRHIKVGSAQAKNEALIKMYITLGFKVYLSTGGHDLNEITPIHPLACVFHCVSKYPAKPTEANMLRLWQIKKRFPSAPLGFSSHLDPLHPDTPGALGTAAFLCEFVEVHFTILRRDETKDGPVSLDSDQLTTLCEWDRLTEKQKRALSPAIGFLDSPQSDEEKALIQRYSTRWNA